jgi:hypothetical protein
MRTSALLTVLAIGIAGCRTGSVKLEDTGGAWVDETGDTSGDTAGDTAGDTEETGDTQETADTEDSVDPAWDDAELVILSPHSGDFLPWGETSTFSAAIIDADGNPMDFDDIEWSSDVDAAWAIEGSSVDDASLDVGTHALTATARLPNGDRLAYSVGGILVQSVYTGVYSGTLQIDITIQGYTVGCAGGASIVVDAYGETVTGDASCLVSINGYDLDMAYAFDLANTAGAVDGDVGADLVWFTYNFGSSGTLSEEGAIDGTFEDDVFGVMGVAGHYTAERVSRDISDVEPTE